MHLNKTCTYDARVCVVISNLSYYKNMSEIFRLLEKNAQKLIQRLKESPVKKINNISIPYFALLLSFFQRPFIAIQSSQENAFKLYKDCLFFLRLMKEELQSSIAFFPPNSNAENIGVRCKAIYEFSLDKTLGLITSFDAIDTGFKISTINNQLFSLTKGFAIDRDRLSEILNRLGYREVSLVFEKGDYARRGWIFDIYPVTYELPVRIEFFGDEIDIIRHFDIESQRTIKEIDKISLLPASEEERVNNIIEEFLRMKSIDIFCEVSAHKDIVEKKGYEPENYIEISHLPFISDGINAEEMPLSGLGMISEERKSFDELVQFVSKTDKKVLMILPSEAQAQRLKEIFFARNTIIPVVENSELLFYEGSKCITTGLISSGINLPQLYLLSGREIFGERPEYRPFKRSKLSNILSQIEDLHQGDFIVHEDHGIGRFIGLQMQSIEDYKEELIIIEYAGGDRLYIPSYSVDKINKYSASEGHEPSLDRLGSKRWQKTKKRVKECIKVMAEKLLRLYAERKVSKGFRFSEDTSLHREFDEFFPYEETEDQLKAFMEVKKHMLSDKPMDMLLCGDVGFGKTEVAMRAAFRAVYDGKQVAVVVPTTILAEQHYRTFKARFSAFPVRIDYLSRFKSTSEVKKCLNQLSKGELDIIIGTHMLLKRDILFSDLGLLIIDEEHRFGVSQKERLKEIKKGIDVLTLTATPIPRTLHLSLSGIREMSTIETPPEERLAVRTFITVFGENTIKEALEREIKRGGQAFFVHNRIRDIDKIAELLKRLMPHLRISIAHGRMREIELEEIMFNFLEGKIDVLVCTSIIGSGLDITNANTLIVNRAETFGLSDLYQLRGRVGRSSTQAYAYFLISGEETISNDAKKRLHALHEMSYLGAGLRLALRDLEIRGAGNILGKEQSGHIHKVGFDIYLEMLEKTVAEIKGEIIIEELEPQIRLRFSAMIPDDYISDITLRLGFYRRISLAKSIEAISDLKDELDDRFGSLPIEVLNLLQIMRLKLLAKKLYIKKIIDMGRNIRFLFAVDSDNFKIPEGFYDITLKNLFAIASEIRRIRFQPDGFDLNTAFIGPSEALKLSEEILHRLVIQANISK